MDLSAWWKCLLTNLYLGTVLNPSVVTLDKHLWLHMTDYASLNPIIEGLNYCFYICIGSFMMNIMYSSHWENFVII